KGILLSHSAAPPGEIPHSLYREAGFFGRARRAQVCAPASDLRIHDSLKGPRIGGRTLISKRLWMSCRRMMTSWRRLAQRACEPVQAACCRRCRGTFLCARGDYSNATRDAPYIFGAMEHRAVWTMDHTVCDPDIPDSRGLRHRDSRRKYDVDASGSGGDGRVKSSFPFKYLHHSCNGAATCAVCRRPFTVFRIWTKSRPARRLGASGDRGSPQCGVRIVRLRLSAFREIS